MNSVQSPRRVGNQEVRASDLVNAHAPFLPGQANLCRNNFQSTNALSWHQALIQINESPASWSKGKKWHKSLLIDLSSYLQLCPWPLQESDHLVLRESLVLVGWGQDTLRYLNLGWLRLRPGTLSVPSSQEIRWKQAKVGCELRGFRACWPGRRVAWTSGEREKHGSSSPNHSSTALTKKKSWQANSDPRLLRPWMASNFSCPPTWLLPPLGSKFPHVP